MTVCHIKLSNGLLVHGPQCHSEAEAKEKAALFALQRLVRTAKNLLRYLSLLHWSACNPSFAYFFKELCRS